MSNERVDKGEQSEFESNGIEEGSTHEQEEKEIKDDNEQESTGEVKSSELIEDEDSSGDSVSLDDVLEEINDMYGDSDDEEEMEEELEEEEEETEEENLSEYRLWLQEKYLEDEKLDAKHLEKFNKMIEEVPHQIYAIEIYINSIRTFYGYSNHWIRIKVFDSPCFEIRPCTKVESHASLYANQSTKESKGSGLMRSQHDRVPEEPPAPPPTLLMSEGDLANQKKSKQVVIDMTALDFKRNTIDEIMKEEVTPAKTALWSMINLKIESKVQDLEVDLPHEEAKLWKANRRSTDSNCLDEKVYILKEPIENGKTVMFPMEPLQMVHQLQRQPMQIFVMSTSGNHSLAFLPLDGLLEAVIRASKGPPYPISSAQRFNILTTGQFTAKVKGIVKLTAIGPEHISQVSCEENPNEKMSGPRRKEVHSLSNWNTDIQVKPPILTGPQKFNLYDVVKSIRDKREAKKSKPPPEPEPKKYYTENLVFNRKANTVVRAPKKTATTLRAEIDRYLVLNKSMADKKVEAELTETRKSEESCEEEEEMFEAKWAKFKRKEEKLNEHENAEEENNQLEEENGLESNSERIETVFRSLLETYGQKLPTYPFTHFSR